MSVMSGRRTKVASIQAPIIRQVPGLSVSHPFQAGPIPITTIWIPSPVPQVAQPWAPWAPWVGPSVVMPRKVPPIGAGVGALAGIFSAAGNHRHKKNRYAQQQAQQAQQAAEFAQDQANYKRAISACLEAHDYTVK